MRLQKGVAFLQGYDIVVSLSGIESCHDTSKSPTVAFFFYSQFDRVAPSNPATILQVTVQQLFFFCAERSSERRAQQRQSEPQSQAEQHR